MEEKQLLDKLWENYGLSYDDARRQRQELESLHRATRRIAELKRKISGLGSVNVGAIEEYQRVSERYDYLTGQRDDVEQAKGDLEGIINGITDEMKNIFARQFGQISEAFPPRFGSYSAAERRRWSWRIGRTSSTATLKSKYSRRERR